MRSDVARLGRELLEQEARGLLTRLDQVQPFALSETMVLAAALPFPAHAVIERFLHAGRNSLRRQVDGYLRWLRTDGRHAPPDEQQRRFVLIRLQFNSVLSQLDLFTEVVTQRSEHETGVWLSGLDVLARDALTASPMIDNAPPVVCYLARGPGAAIRRARTRLPGGDANPVAIVRVPRERMVGHGIASSLVHEVGHQVAALLGLVESLKPALAERAGESRTEADLWRRWSTWSSEIVADLWSVGMLGISSTLGLLAVVSLPSFFVFRPSGDDPHPTPYLRVLLSAEIGRQLYPHRQWDAMSATWKAMYPTNRLTPAQARQIGRLEESIPTFVATLVGHRPPAIGGLPLRSLFPLEQRQPEALLERYLTWRTDPVSMARQPPSLVFAAVGQARAAGRIAPEAESDLLSGLLRLWALRSSLAGIEASHPNQTPPGLRLSLPSRPAPHPTRSHEWNS